MPSSFPPTIQAAAALRPLRALFEVAKEHGVDVDGALRSVGVDPALTEIPDLRVDGLKLRDVLLAVSRGAPDAPIGLLAAQRLREGDFGLFDFLLASAESLREAANLAQSFYQILDGSAELKLFEEGRQASLAVVPFGKPVITGVIAEYTMAAVKELVLRFTDHSLRPNEVRFAHNREQHRRLFEDYFQAPVVFGAERDEIVFPRVYLDLRLPRADAALRATLTAHATHVLAESQPTETFVERVRRLVLTDLREGKASLDDLAVAVRMSRRTLQRRLQDAGTSHLGLVDEMRHQLALEYLEHTDWSVGRVAEKLGFSDTSTFSRAFRRWTSMSPGEWKGTNGRGHPKKAVQREADSSPSAT
jgi:AraC-like DNA-binding protein